MNESIRERDIRALTHLIRRSVAAFALFVASVFPTFAKDWYVSPTGSGSGSGSLSNPFDLDTALGTQACKPPSAIRSGDTLWLLPGTYRSTASGSGFKSCLVGTAAAPIKVRPFSPGRAIIDGSGTNFVIYVSGAYTWFINLEVEVSRCQRTSATPGSNAGPSCLAFGPSIYAPGIKFINCFVHDTAEGFSLYNAAPDAELYGNVVVYNGYVGPDRNHGHGIYVQNNSGAKLIQANLVGDNADEGIQAYGSPSSSQINTTLDSNAVWNNGSWPTLHYASNLIMTGGNAHHNAVTNNMSYFTMGTGQGANNFGQYYDGQYDLTVTGNTIVGGNVEAAVEGVRGPVLFRNNRLASVIGKPLYTIVVALFSDENYAGYSWDNNSYFGENSFYQGLYDGNNLSGGVGLPFVAFRAQSTLDSHSRYSATLPTGKWITITPNKYEAKRANIVIYNWDAYADQYGDFQNPCTGACASVAVDLSNVLANGDPFVIRDAQNFTGPPVVSGTYSGSVSIPLIGLTKAAVLNITNSNGSPMIPAHTTPGYGVFIVCSPDCGLGADIPQPPAPVHTHAALGSKFRP